MQEFEITRGVSMAANTDVDMDGLAIMTIIPVLVVSALFPHVARTLSIPRMGTEKATYFSSRTSRCSMSNGERALES